MLTGWAERKKSGPRSLGQNHQSWPRSLGRDHRGRGHWAEITVGRGHMYPSEIFILKLLVV